METIFNRLGMKRGGEAKEGPTPVRYCSRLRIFEWDQRDGRRLKKRISGKITITLRGGGVTHSYLGGILPLRRGFGERLSSKKSSGHLRFPNEGGIKGPRAPVFAPAEDKEKARHSRDALLRGEDRGPYVRGSYKNAVLPDCRCTWACQGDRLYSWPACTFWGRQKEHREGKRRIRLRPKRISKMHPKSRMSTRLPTGGIKEGLYRSGIKGGGGGNEESRGK